MNENDTNVGTWQSVIVIVREDGVLKGVELRKSNGSTEILWTKSAENPNTDWRTFAAECGLPNKPTENKNADGDKIVVIGFGSTGTVFHRANVPPVGENEIESIVRLQAETRLPLPAEQTELAWRTDPVQNGQLGVTMVVARKELLQRFADDVTPLNPTKILLDCEGLIRAWKTVFSEHEKEAVVVSVGQRSAQVCLARDGRLCNAVILDFGLDDFSGQMDTPEDASTENHETQTEAIERFIQDMRSVMNLFGFTNPSEIPVFMLSDDSAVYSTLVSSMQSSDLKARVDLPNVRTLSAEGKSGIEWIYDYRAAIGLGLIALDDRADELNIFENVYKPLDKDEKKHWLLSPIVSGAIACVMLLALAIVSYAIDKKTPKAIMDRVEASTSVAKTSLDSLVERQRLIKAVARERPDMLTMIKTINECGENGITLDSIHFKKGQKVIITGQVRNNDQLYNFQEKLNDQKDITEAKIQSTGKVTSRSGGSSGRSVGPGGPPSSGPSSGPPSPPGGRSSRGSFSGPPSRGGPGGSRGGGGITFTITFHYKNFTKKPTRAQK